VVAEWRDLGTLRASLDGGEVELVAVPGVDPILEEKWRHGAARALVRHLQRRPTLHGSAVGLGGTAVCFLGDSGAGKSTCAADLCARLGAELLADDLTEIDVVEGKLLVCPSERWHWLLGDSAGALGYPPAPDKEARLARRVGTEPVPLAALVSLAFGDGGAAPALTPLRGAGAFLAINAAYSRFVIDDPATIQGDLHRIADLVAEVPMFTLTRPRSFADLPRVATLVCELVERLNRKGVR
jgi:hypothetical protein